MSTPCTEGSAFAFASAPSSSAASFTCGGGVEQQRVERRRRSQQQPTTMSYRAGAEERDRSRTRARLVRRRDATQLRRSRDAWRVRGGAPRSSRARESSGESAIGDVCVCSVALARTSRSSYAMPSRVHARPVHCASVSRRCRGARARRTGRGQGGVERGGFSWCDGRVSASGATDRFSASVSWGGTGHMRRTLARCRVGVGEQANQLRRSLFVLGCNHRAHFLREGRWQGAITTPCCRVFRNGTRIMVGKAIVQAGRREVGGTILPGETVRRSQPRRLSGRAEASPWRRRKKGDENRARTIFHPIEIHG